MKEKKTILVAFRRKAESDNAKEILTRQSYNVLVTNTAKGITNILDQRLPHLLLVDMHLPGRGGLSLIRSLRKFCEAPLIVLSESNDENNIVKALDAGASDVLDIPFGRSEHLARIRAALRSSNVFLKKEEIFSIGGLTLNYATRSVEIAGAPIHLTPIEFRILALLTINPGKVMTYEQIINEIWGPYNSDNLVLRVNMANIRRKIEVNPAEPRYVVTEVGIGYRLIS
ncbi:MAG: winged helix-turn-helix domain-containing protein [Defluviitaleaceae bacterium]|nr:winged helix-turn-helix domain-containing protein [Defluviitaleaceae bacterium]